MADDRPSTSARLWRLGAVIVVVIGIVVRFTARSHLWLDEAQTVNIARLPLGQLPEALRHDGGPPLYYFLLHGWMLVVGTGTVAVRALSGIFAVAALPVMWVVGRRIGGPRVAWAAVLLLAASPFAVRYGTEVRMYSLMVLLSLVGWLAFTDLLERFSWSRAATLATTTGALLLTNYWSLFLLIVAMAVVVHRIVGGRGRDQAIRAGVALAAGSVLFLPWVPSFVYQLRHTGAPWGGPPPIRAFFDAVFHFAGGFSEPGRTLGLIFFGLIALALVARPIESHQLVLAWRIRPEARGLAIAAFGTLAIGLFVSTVMRTPFAVRYASVAFPFALLLVARGAAVLVNSRGFRPVLALCVILGLVAIVPNVVGDRTNASRVARAIRAQARPGDVVAYCPDQLGPAVSRLLPGHDLLQTTFPLGLPPTRVDWVGYASRNRAALTVRFARTLIDRAGPANTVWLVWAPGYRTLHKKCENLIARLGHLRPDMKRVIKVTEKYEERPGLVRFPPPPARPRLIEPDDDRRRPWSRSNRSAFPDQPHSAYWSQ